MKNEELQKAAEIMKDLLEGFCDRKFNFMADDERWEILAKANEFVKEHLKESV